MRQTPKIKNILVNNCSGMDVFNIFNDGNVNPLKRDLVRFVFQNIFYIGCCARSKPNMEYLNTNFFNTANVSLINI